MPTRFNQSGSALIVTMMIMVVMAITGLALLRSVDTGNLVAGNIGFKQAAIISADSALKDSASYLTIGTLTDNSAADGYYATGNQVFDWTGQLTPGDTVDDVDWDGTQAGIATKAKQLTFPNGTTVDASGNKAYYVIHRLCDHIGSSGAVGTSCATSNSQSAAIGSTRVSASYGQKALTTTVQVYYRITVKVVGPRNTVSYSQAFLLI